MAHLSTIYARDLNVKVGNPIIQPHFFPTPKEKYITIHNSDKVPAKSYSYWPDVIKILKPELEKRNIKIIQIGTKEDQIIDGVDDFINTTTFKQSFYLIKNSLLQVGIDSCPIHIASALEKPTVSIYSHTYAKTCDPLWNKDKAIIIESHRNGKKPSFSLNEDPKTIDIIKPEEIANACFKQLQFKEYTTQETLFIGKKYKSKILDIIPSEEPLNLDYTDVNIRVRLDLDHNEEVLFKVLSRVKSQVEIISAKPVNESILKAFLHKISKVIYCAPNFDGEFLNYLKHSGLDFELNCTDKNQLSAQRNKFFNFDIVYENLIKDAKKLRRENKDKIKEGSKFYSGRFYIQGGKTLASLAKSPKDLNFWLDIPYFRVYSERNERKN